MAIKARNSRGGRRVLAVGLGLLLVAVNLNAQDGTVFLHSPALSRSVSVKSWKALRDERIVKQNRDYSCGAASLATVLNEYYGQAVTEADLLRAMATGDARESFEDLLRAVAIEDAWSSFEDMHRAVLPFGFRAVGISASYKQLAKLKMPVIVYLEHRQGGHFSVLRGSDEKTVWLADPSLGNHTYSRAQFLAMWKTRTGEDDLQGKILAVFPAQSGITARDDFFTKTPRRQTAQAVAQIGLRISK